MDRPQLPRALRPFIDDAGRLTQWPSRQATQRMAVALIARRFDPAREYSEREVNFILMDAHSFGDWAILRRSLVDWRWLDREGDGSRYRLRDPAPVDPLLAGIATPP
jgi:hypothetical protein